MFALNRHTFNIQLHGAKYAHVDGIEFTRRYHLPMLRKMKANLIGSSFVFSFYIDNSDAPCKGVFSNGSDPLTYLSTELFPLLSSGIPKIAIYARCLSNSSVKFYEQFLVPFLSMQRIIVDANSVEIETNHEVEDSQFCSVSLFPLIRSSNGFIFLEQTT